MSAPGGRPDMLLKPGRLRFYPEAETCGLRPYTLCGPPMIQAAVAERREMPILLERTAGRLPAGFIQLEADAKADGHRHVTRLSVEFAKDRAMFHAILVCYIDDEVAGIGAITEEPAWTSQPTWRMRRLYVHRKFRRRKVARAIAFALLQEAAEKVRMVTVHAGSEEASQFWEAIGFRRVTGRSWSHEKATSDTNLRV